MKNTILLFFILLYPFVILGQKQTSINLFTAVHSNIAIITEKHSPSLIQESAKLGFGFSYGAQVQLLFQNSIFFRFGLQKQFFKHKFLYEGFRFGFGIPDFGNTSLQNSIDIKSIIIPFDIGHYWNISDKLDFFIGIEAALRLKRSTNTTATIYQNDEKKEDLIFASNKIVQSIISCGWFGGIEYSVLSQLVLGIEAQINYVPNQYSLYLFHSSANNIIECGLTLKLRYTLE